MKCIESSSLDLSLNVVVIHDIGLRAAEFNRFKAQFVLRQCIRVADVLAHASKNLGSQTWVDEAPRCILEALAQDIGD